MLKAFERFGSTAIPMHLALFTIPLKIAVTSAFRSSCGGRTPRSSTARRSPQAGHPARPGLARTYGVTHGTTAADWADELERQGPRAYFGPTPTSSTRAASRAVFLGHYFPWDPETSAAVARRHGFESASGLAHRLLRLRRHRRRLHFHPSLDEVVQVRLHPRRSTTSRLRSATAADARGGNRGHPRRGDQTPHEDIADVLRVRGHHGALLRDRRDGSATATSGRAGTGAGRSTGS